MNSIVRAGRAYWQWNERVWNFIKAPVSRSPWPFFAVLVAAFVGVSIALNDSGHAQAAFVVTMVMALVCPLAAIYLVRDSR